MDRTQKEEMVASLRQAFNDAAVVVVTHNKGITAGEATDLRRRMGAVGARFRVTKNRLTRLALEGTPYQGLSDLFVGPTAIAYSDDPVAAAKASADFAKDNDRLVILGGAMGEKALDVDGVKALASLPSLDELRGKIVGLLNAPATRMAGVLAAPGGQLARVFAAHGASEDAA